MPSIAHTLYFYRYTPAGRKASIKTRFRMTPEDAAERYAGLHYERLEADKIEVPAGLDMGSHSTSCFSRKV
jgi:hypothetical protein